VILIIVCKSLFAQIDTGLLLELTKATTAEMNAVSPEKGTLLYNTDVDKIYHYNGTSWSAVSGQSKWIKSGNNQYSAISGNVGIGVSNPNEKLVVQGKIAHSGAIRSKGSTYSSDWMRFQEHQWGNSLILGAGGKTILGGGEFATTAQPHFSASNEELTIGSDSHISFYVNTQSGWANNIRVMRMTNTGNVGIGMANPSAKLSVNGTVNKPGGGTWSVLSDERSKENIKNYSKGLNELVQLRPVSFNYKKSFDFGSETHVGFVAQEVEKIVPSMVSEKDMHGLKDFRQVDANEVTFMLINAVKELKIENELLKTRLKALEKK
jgi:hypothetical protein